ncbi:hypothetical protein STVA_41700 [Allostella vacuolata]|nr:hypothetical protein STVA_41700 [Stella vacuolata]
MTYPSAATAAIDPAGLAPRPHIRLARHITEIAAGNGGCVTERDLARRGWSRRSIDRHLPAARALLPAEILATERPAGRVDVPARRRPLPPASWPQPRTARRAGR